MSFPHPKPMGVLVQRGACVLGYLPSCGSMRGASSPQHPPLCARRPEDAAASRCFRGTEPHRTGGWGPWYPTLSQRRTVALVGMGSLAQGMACTGQSAPRLLRDTRAAPRHSHLPELIQHQGTIPLLMVYLLCYPGNTAESF